MPDATTIALLLGGLFCFVVLQCAWSIVIATRRLARPCEPPAVEPPSAPLECICGRCEPGQTFRCIACERDVPWCAGAAGDDDDSYDLCDECWYARQGAPDAA